MSAAQVCSDITNPVCRLVLAQRSQRQAVCCLLWVFARARGLCAPGYPALGGGVGAVGAACPWLHPLLCTAPPFQVLLPSPQPWIRSVAAANTGERRVCPIHNPHHNSRAWV